MTNQQRISGVDTAWLRMEQPTNLMMIVGVMMLEGRVRAADLERVLEARFLGGYPRFRQRARVDATGAWWETPARFRLRDHVHRVRLPGAAGKEELEALVSELASTPLDAARPLWDFHLVENYAGGSALVARIHHCYADGIALVQVMLSLTHATAAGSLRLAGKASTPHPPDEEDFWSQLLAPVTAALGNAPQAARSLLAQGRGLAERPEAAAEAVQELARKCGAFAAEVARLLLMGPDAATRFKGPLGTRKRAAWAEPLPLDQVKIVGKALGCSINDVLVSMAAGALRDYLEEKGDPVDGLEIRAVVPVNLRPQGSGRGLGNQFGLVFLELPIGIAHPLERLYEVRRRMLALKGSYQPLIALGLLSAIGYGPRALQDPVTALLGGSASAVITNVPGPQHPLFLAGRHITELDFWVPQSGGIGVGVSILSYDGRIQFGIVTDAGLVPDPGRIVGRFGEEFARLLWITLMSPWAEGDAAPPAAKASERLRKR
ncbi:MAG TPA: wax ester/triacylglycerol synthase family O-acyltransferase [Usitatibacter sp.]|nr:wax ester/triacylglycerol synthase family O-acyltransferase [Usitatibacter sp.]